MGKQIIKQIIEHNGRVSNGSYGVDPRGGRDRGWDQAPKPRTEIGASQGGERGRRGRGGLERISNTLNSETK